MDNKLVAIFPTAQAKETTYQSNHGRYWQGLAWCSVPPPDGADAIPPNLATHPYYEAETWLDVFPALAANPQPMCLLVDNYDGPQGQGYVACVGAMSQGTIYVRCQNTGPETWRTFGWRAVEL